jgi:hypothetical protein
MMKVKFNAPRSNAVNLGDKKELVRAWNVVALQDDGTLRELVTVRWYRSYRASPESPEYCSVWVSPRDNSHTSGRGTSRGHGIHTASAALQNALISAGVELQDRAGARVYIDGKGEGAMRTALAAIATTCGCSTSLLVEVN